MLGSLASDDWEVQDTSAHHLLLARFCYGPDTRPRCLFETELERGGTGREGKGGETDR